MSREKQEEKARRSKKKLMEAAAKLFNEKKIEDVGVREIASFAGMTTGTFYHYFKGKDDILDQLYLDHDEEFSHILKEYSEGEGPYSEKIVYFFAHILANVVMADGVDFTRHRMFQMQKHSTDGNLLYIGMKRLIERAMEQGELNTEITVSEINEYIFMVFRGIVYEWCICSQESKFLLNEKIEKFIRYALNAFRTQEF